MSGHPVLTPKLEQPDANKKLLQLSEASSSAEVRNTVNTWMNEFQRAVSAGLIDGRRQLVTDRLGEGLVCSRDVSLGGPAHLSSTTELDGVGACRPPQAYLFDINPAI